MNGRGKPLVYLPPPSAAELAAPELFEPDTVIKFKRAKKFKRTHSYLSLFDPETESKAKFIQTRQLGSGTYGQAFECQWERISIVEKKPHAAKIYYDDIADMQVKINSLMREADLVARAHDASTSTVLFIWPTFPTPENYFMPVSLDFRLISKFIPGQPLYQIIDGKDDIDFAAVALYQAAVALNQLHEKGIIHGDVSPGNTIVTPELSVKYIDFGLARLAGDLVETFDMTPDQIETTYIAPERINTEFCVAHTSQDIYSLAYSMKFALTTNYSLETLLSFYQRYPCIETFITNGLTYHPEERPVLPDFIKELHDMLAIPLLKLWLRICRDEDIESFIQNNIHQFTDNQLTRLVFSLLEQKSERADFMIDTLRKYQPGYCDDGLFDLFKVIAELSSQMKHIHTGRFFEATRKKIINDLSAAFAFARNWIENLGEFIDKSVADRIKDIPVLQAIYENIPEADSDYSSDSPIPPDAGRSTSYFSM